MDFFFLSVCCEFVIQQERRWVQRGEVFNKTVSWHQSKPYSPKTALCLSLVLLSALWGCVCVVLLSSSTPMVALSSFLAAQGEIWSRIKGNSEARRYVHTRLWSPAKGKTEETGSRNRSTELPVFWGPTTMNLGSLSQVFSLDQMSLCRLSSHGF